MSLETQADTPALDLRKGDAASGDPTDTSQYTKRWWILTVLAIAQLMIILDTTVVSIALPTAQADLGFNNADRQWIVTAYALAFGSLLLLGGRLADMFGRKQIFLIGIAGFAIASAVGGAAVNFGMLVTARAVQGAFGALLAPAILSLLTTTFLDARERGKAFGVFGAIGGAGASIGLLLGGILTEYANWRWTMYINLVFAVIALVGGVMLIGRDKITTGPRLDIPGTLLITGGLFALVYGFSHAETASWSSSVTVAFLAIAVVLLVAFVVTEMRVAHPLLPLRVVLDRNRGGALFAMFAASAGMFGVFLFLTYYLQASRGFSAVQTGVAFLPMTGVLIVVASIVSTTLVLRVSARILIPLGLAIAAVGLYLMTHISLTSSYASTVLPAVMVLGVGLALVFAPAFNLGVLGVDPQDSGVASANVNAMQQVGGSIGTALFNTLAASAASAYVSSHLGHGPAALVQANAAIHSYTTAFWVAAAVFAGAAVVCAFLLRSGIAQADGEAVPAVI